MPKRARLTTDEKAEILRMRVEGRMSIPEIARAMGSNTATIGALVRPYNLTDDELRARKAANAVNMRAKRVSYGKCVGGHLWTAEDVSTLKRLWPMATKKQIADAYPDRSWGALEKQATALFIKRSQAANRPQAKQKVVDRFFVMLREIRENRRISRPELAERIGIHTMMLTRYELGLARPSWLRMRDWLDALGYEIQPIPKEPVDGKHRGKKQWLLDEERNMRELLSQGSTTAEISQALRRPLAEVETRLRTLGLNESERERNASGMMKARLS